MPLNPPPPPENSVEPAKRPPAPMSHGLMPFSALLAPLLFPGGLFGPLGGLVRFIPSSQRNNEGLGIS